MSGPKTENPAQNEPMIVTKYTYRYHNDSLGVLNLLVLGLVGLIAALGFFIFVQIGTEPRPLHFELDQNLQIIQQTPLDQEGITSAALLNWVNEFVMKSFSFNYSNVQKQASKLAPYFSDAAMKIYLDILNTDEDLKNIGTNQFVVSIVPKAPPEVVLSKAFQGRFAWQIQVSADIIFSNAAVKASQAVLFNFLIWRVPETTNPLGITVATFTRDIVSRTTPYRIKHGF